MPEDYDVITADFDKIALLNEPKWNHNNCYFDYLIKLVPDDCQNILDIGCGKGELSQMLSKKSKHITAIDLSEVMIKQAKLKNSSCNIEYICGNVLDFDFSNQTFDIIITTATSHHLPYDWLLKFAHEKLNKDGKLIILDLIKSEKWWEFFYWGFACIPNIFMNIIKNKKIFPYDKHSLSIWKNHCKNDNYMSFNEIKKISNKYLNNPKIKRKLFWRYILVWKKDF